jgi:uncharacterized repeat protein (TIGR01451 family)
MRTQLAIVGIALAAVATSAVAQGTGPAKVSSQPVIPRTAGVQFTKTVLTRPAAGTNGSVFTYELVAHIPARTPMSNAVITDQLPSGMRFLGQTGFRCLACGVPAPIPPRRGSNPAVWNIGRIPTHLTARTLRIWYRAIVTRSAGVGAHLNSAALSYRVNTTRVTISVTNAVEVRAPRLAIIKTVRCGGGSANTSDHTCTVGPDLPLAYTLTVTNTGGWSAYDATVTDTPPAGLVGLAGISSHGRLHHGRIIWHLPRPIAPGRSVRLTYTARVTGAAADLTDGEHLVNHAVIGRYWGLPLLQRLIRRRDAVTYPGGAFDADSLTVRLPALALTKTHSGDMSRNGSGTYTLSVANVGSWPTSAPVTVTDSPPVGMVVLVASGHGWSCAIQGISTTCRRADALAPGATYPSIELGVALASNAPDVIVNTAIAVGGGSRQPARAEDTTFINGPRNDASATLGISADRSHAVPGGLIAYTLRLDTPPPLALVGARVCNPVPAYTALVAAPGAQLVHGTPCWTVGYLAVGGVRSFGFTVRVSRLAPPVTVVNTATVVSYNAPTVAATVRVRVTSTKGSGGVTG